MTRFFWNVFIFFFVTFCVPVVYGVPTIIGEQIQVDGQDFAIEKEIGSGGFGHIYQIRSIKDPSLLYALKIFTHKAEKATYNTQQMRAGRNKAYQKIIQLDPDGSKLRFAPRFVKVKLDPNVKLDAVEASALAGHPTTDLVIVMPLATSDLRGLISVSGKNPADRIKLALKVVDDVLPELAVLANNELVHNDIKIDNILVSTSGKLGITDFDTVVRAGTPMPINTPYYLAPERGGRNLSAPVYPVSDIYSLGVVAGLIIIPNSPADQLNIDVRDSEVFNAYLDRLEAEVKQLHPEMVESYRRLRQFLDASLESIPSERLDKLSKYTTIFTSERMKERRSADRKTQDIDQLRKVLLTLNNETISAKFLSDWKRPFMKAASSLAQLVRENPVYVEAFLLAKLIDIEIPDGKSLLYSKLRSAPFRETRQISNLRAYLKLLSNDGSQALEPELLKILLQRFILPKGSNLNLYDDIIRMVSRRPSVISTYQDALVARIKSAPAHSDSMNLSRLFVNFEMVPDDVLLAWLEIAVSVSTRQSTADEIQLAIKNQKKISANVVSAFLFSSHDDTDVLRQKVKLLSVLRTHVTVEFEYSDKRFLAYLNSDHPHIRWEVANLVLEAGIKNEKAEKIFVDDGLSYKKMSASGVQVQVGVGSQARLARSLRFDAGKENVAADMLYRQKHIYPEIAVWLAGELGSVTGARRLSITMLLLNNDSVASSIKKSALVAMAELMGDPGVQMKLILDQIRKSANADTWSPSFEKVFRVRKAQNAIEPDGIFLAPSSYSDAELSRLRDILSLPTGANLSADDIKYLSSEIKIGILQSEIKDRLARQNVFDQPAKRFVLPKLFLSPTNNCTSFYK